MDVPAQSWEQVEKLLLFSAIPVARICNTFLRCSACGRQLTATINLDDIGAHLPDELEPFLSIRKSFVGSALAVLCILVFWAPVLGLTVAASALLVNWRRGGWARILSAIGVVLATIMNILLLLMWITH
jgi:hypothetical protein